MLPRVRVSTKGLCLYVQKIQQMIRPIIQSSNNLVATDAQILQVWNRLQMLFEILALEIGVE